MFIAFIWDVCMKDIIGQHVEFVCFVNKKGFLSDKSINQKKKI